MSAPTAAPTAAEPSRAVTRAGATFASPRAAGTVLLVAGLTGLAASSVLTIEKFTLLADPSHRPSCSINPVLSCGSIMTSPQAAAFGFPNPILGLIGFTIAVVTGVLAAAGVVLPRWYWTALAAGLLAGAVFVHWLIFQSLYRIDALCPYCMLVWVATVTSLLYVVLHTATRRPASRWQRAVAVVATHHTVVLTVWGLTVAALITEGFWTYWRTLI